MRLCHHTVSQSLFRHSVFQILLDILDCQKSFTGRHICSVYLLDLSLCINNIIGKGTLPMGEEIRIQILPIELLYERGIPSRNMRIPEVFPDHGSILALDECIRPLSKAPHPCNS